jgi:hypothetical protein
MFMEIVDIYDNFESANKKAKYYAKWYSQKYNKAYVEDKVDIDYLEMSQAIVKYTIFDGYEHMVYAVVQLPKKEIY